MQARPHSQPPARPQAPPRGRPVPPLGHQPQPRWSRQPAARPRRSPVFVRGPAIRLDRGHRRLLELVLGFDGRHNRLLDHRARRDRRHVGRRRNDLDLRGNCSLGCRPNGRRRFRDRFDWWGRLLDHSRSIPDLAGRLTRRRFDRLDDLDGRNRCGRGLGRLVNHRARRGNLRFRRGRRDLRRGLGVRGRRFEPDTFEIVGLRVGYCRRIERRPLGCFYPLAPELWQHWRHHRKRLCPHRRSTGGRGDSRVEDVFDRRQFRRLWFRYRSVTRRGFPHARFRSFGAQFVLDQPRHAEPDLALAHDHDIGAKMREVLFLFVRMRAGDDADRRIELARLLGRLPGFKGIGDGDDQRPRASILARSSTARLAALPITTSMPAACAAAIRASASSMTTNGVPWRP